MVNGTLLNFGKRYKDDLLKGHFWSMAKVALRFGCAKQSKNLEWCLLSTYSWVSNNEQHEITVQGRRFSKKNKRTGWNNHTGQKVLKKTNEGTVKI